MAATSPASTRVTKIPAAEGPPARIGGWLLDAAILVLATLGTYGALLFDRPRTAVLVYLVGVLVVGARSGLYRGVLAALVASFVYNFFLSEPRFRFGASSIDEVVPLLAFNVCAVISGGLAGRLNDRARAAREAEAQNAVLLDLSDHLQRAITVPDVARLARGALSAHGLLDLSIETASPPPAREGAGPGASADGLEPQPSHSFRLGGAGGDLGIARFSLAEADGRRALPDLQAVANLLALAIDRCVLLDQLSESRAARRSEELKDALLSSVSHDLRTPLTAIEAAATTLQAFRGSLEPAQEAEMLATIADQCAKLNRYTANLLDMGRIHGGIPDEQLGAVDLLELLGVALGAIRKRFPGQRIDKRVAAGPVTVRANAAMLEQTIFNLLENAVIHGGAAAVRVEASVLGEHAVLEIADQGPGIPPPEQPRVFERFYRGRHGSQREGSGLGLYIARGFVEAFGGSVELRSPVAGGTGTALVIRLPLARSAQGPGESRCTS